MFRRSLLPLSFLGGICLLQIGCVKMSGSGSSSHLDRELAAAPAAASTAVTPYVLNSTADSGPGTLRGAINYLNATPNGTVDCSALIQRASQEDSNGNFLGAVINVKSQLPTITRAGSVLDCRMTGYKESPSVTLTGFSAGQASGFYVTADSVTIAGFQILGFSLAGIAVQASNATVRGNLLGGIYYRTWEGPNALLPLTTYANPNLQVGVPDPNFFLYVGNSQAITMQASNNSKLVNNVVLGGTQPDKEVGVVLNNCQNTTVDSEQIFMDRATGNAYGILVNGSSGTAITNLWATSVTAAAVQISGISLSTRVYQAYITGGGPTIRVEKAQSIPAIDGITGTEYIVTNPTDANQVNPVTRTLRAATSAMVQRIIFLVPVTPTQPYVEILLGAPLWLDNGGMAAEIDGSTQPVYNPVPGQVTVQISGKNYPKNTEYPDGIQIVNNGIVHDLALVNFPACGLDVENSTSFTAYNLHIGIDATGTKAMGNGCGLYYSGYGTVDIHNNLVGANQGAGMTLQNLSYSGYSTSVTKNAVGVAPFLNGSGINVITIEGSPITPTGNTGQPVYYTND